MERYLLTYGDAPEALREELLDRASSILTSREFETFERYRVVRKRLEFVAGRALVRERLGDRFPEPTVELELGPRGKPHVSDGPHFNISNSHEGIFLCVSETHPVGCDLEKVRSIHPRVAKKVFHPEERDDIESETDFFRYWTAKEAYMKLTGQGFGIRPLDLIFDRERGAIRHVPEDCTAPLGQTLSRGYVLSWTPAPDDLPELVHLSLEEVL